MEDIWVWLVMQVVLVVSIYFLAKRAKSSGAQETKKPRHSREECREMRELKQMRARSLSMPLSERARPAQMEDIIGQRDGIRALRAALCGPNPQHVLIYGPPGCGKTCAARLVLDEAKRGADSPVAVDS